MQERLDFRVELPPPPEGPLVQLSTREAEQLLLRELEGKNTDRVKALWNLAQFYKFNLQHDLAILRLRELIPLLPDPESKANCVFTMGQAMEQVSDYRAAIRYYKEALALEPASTFTWYFIHNNLGYSLNTLGQPTEGEIYCRRAIQIDHNRPNAHKNLGLALAAQGRHHDAAQSFVTATQVNAADKRAFHLLEQLLAEHPELAFDYQDQLEQCRKATAAAAHLAQSRVPKVYRGWKKHLILWASKVSARFKKSSKS